MSFYKDTFGYIIHQRDYKNNSLIIEFFSQDYGLLHIIAKGIKNNKLLKSQIQYFSLLKIQYYGKSNLKTLTSIDVIKYQQFDDIIDRTAGLYLNELLHYSLVEFEKAESIYQSYEDSLSEIGRSKLTPILRSFEKELLKYNGFELNVPPFLNDESWLGIDSNIGLSVTSIQSEKLCKCIDLRQFLDNKILEKTAQKRLNKFMMHAIDMSLNNRRLYSRELLITLTSLKN